MEITIPSWRNWNTDWTYCHYFQKFKLVFDEPAFVCQNTNKYYFNEHFNMVHFSSLHLRKNLLQ